MPAMIRAACRPTWGRLSGNGVTAADADARLSDLSFMMNAPGLPGNSDPLRYEKRVIDDWLRKLLGKR